MLINHMKLKWKLLRAKKRWRKKNKHNRTSVNSIFNQDLCTVGNHTYGIIKVYSTNNLSRLKIGSFCSIGENVHFMLNDEHPTNLVSTYPIKRLLFRGPAESTSKGDILVGDDVWIGNDVTVMSGVSIGQGAVIATGAVVTKDVKPYSIVGGVPAKHIKYRFSDKVINELIKVDYSNMTMKFLSKHLEEFYDPITDETDLSWLLDRS